MEKTLRQAIKEITYKHLKSYKKQVFGQNLTAVGWVAGTLPELYEKDGVIELPMADVAGGGIVTGSALVGKRPMYIIRYQILGRQLIIYTHTYFIGIIGSIIQ